MSQATETGDITGTKDKDYNIIWFTEQCLSNALRLETYIQDAERDGDQELADFFRRAQEASRKGGDTARSPIDWKLIYLQRQSLSGVIFRRLQSRCQYSPAAASCCFRS